MVPTVQTTSPLAGLQGIAGIPGVSLGLPVHEGWGGYTYPIASPVIVPVDTRISPFLCSPLEAQRFMGLVLIQGDVLPPGEFPQLRIATNDEGPWYGEDSGHYPYILEFAGPAPKAGGKTGKLPSNSKITLTNQHPFLYSVLVGVMYFSAPRQPGAMGAYGPQVLRSDFKIQVRADGNLQWAGLDVPTWPDN